MRGGEGGQHVGSPGLRHEHSYGKLRDEREKTQSYKKIPGVISFPQNVPHLHCA